ncbi:MAG: sulfatase, partial [bacterium]|nr:sulfatase [bacterium]
AAVGLIVASLLIATTSHGPHRRPIRLLLVTLDTLRADHLGAYGYGPATSPALDTFARTATVFDDVTCSMPTTLPSHLSILTGLSTAQHEVTENGMVPVRELVSIFELLKRRGARTAAVVSAQVLAREYLTGLGIDEVFFGDGRTPAAPQVPGDAVTARAQDWLSTHGREPFALWLHYFDPHEPYAPQSRFAARFAAGYDGPLSNALPITWLVSLNQEEVAAGLSERDRRHIVDLYDAEIAFLDAELGRLFAFLQQRDLWRETLIVVVGDHGQAHGEGGFWGHGERLLEPVVRVPLLIKLPRQERSHTVREPVETLDILPTLAAWYGLETPAECTGRSLLDPQPPPDRLRIIDRRTYSSAPERQGLALHAGSWKLTFYREAEGPSYHLGKIAGAGGLDGENFYAPGARELRLLPEILATRKASAAPSPPWSRETLEMLRTLGYTR